jgi:hypothetical protein
MGQNAQRFLVAVITKPVYMRGERLSDRLVIIKQQDFMEITNFGD